MRKIAIALILFQLMGCAKPPVVTTCPENEQNQENKTHQHDTPQAPKTNYLKIGAYIGGTVIAILASIGLIAYCCSRKEKSLEAKKIAEQDAKDINRIVSKCDEEIQSNYPDIERALRAAYIHHPEYEGEMELRAILKWHFLQPLPQNWESKPGETFLCRQREYVEKKVIREVRKTLKTYPDMAMTEVFATIERCPVCFLTGVKTYLILDQRLIRIGGENQELTTASSLMNGIARLVYYYEFKDAIIRNDKK